MERNLHVPYDPSTRGKEEKRRELRSISRKDRPFIHDPLEEPIVRPALKTQTTIERIDWLLPSNNRAFGPVD